MVKKLKAKVQPKQESGQLAAAVRESAQQIWLAGLGAFAKAQEEGTKVFEALVKEGTSLQKRTRAATEEKIEEVTGRVGKVATGITRQATGSWDRLEQVFETRVERALSRLGVPTAKEIGALARRVDQLNASVQALGGKPARKARKVGAAAASAAKSAAPKRTRARKAAAGEAPAGQ